MTCSPHRRAWQIACGAWQAFDAAFKKGTSPADEALDLTQAISNSLAFLLYASRDIRDATQWFKQKMTERAARKNAMNDDDDDKNPDDDDQSPDDDDQNYTTEDADDAIEQQFPDDGANPDIPDPPPTSTTAAADAADTAATDAADAVKAVDTGVEVIEDVSKFDFFADAVPILGEALMVIGVVAMIVSIFMKKKKPSCTSSGTIDDWVQDNVNPWLAKHQMPDAAWTQNVRCAGAA